MDLLLDACTLIRLVHSEAYGQYLMTLANYVQNGNIVLLTHDCVIKEWEDHKEGNRKRIVKKITKLHQLPAQAGGGLLPAAITIDHIDLQYQQIDRLLQGAVLLHTPDQINLEFAARYRDRLAPFHNKLDSQNDWELFGSAGLNCERNGIQQLYFVSWNDTDFADPTEKNRTLHPDLQARFPKVKVWYFREIEDFLGQLAQLILPDHLLSYNIVRNEKFSYKASVRKHELDSLYHLWHNIYSEVAFVPPHLLRKYHPFAKPTGGYTYYSLFSMNEVRHQLVEMFEGVEISEAGVRIIKPELFTGIKDTQDKLEYVLLKMTGNLIFRLSCDTGAKTVNVRYHGNDHCDCMRCTYQRLEWHRSIKELAKPQEELHERLKQAFFYYQFGNYTAATRAFLELRDEAEKQKKYITYFICLYNLHHLGFFLSNVFYPHTLTSDEIADLKAIDPFEQCVKLKSRTDYDLLVYIADGNFFKDTFDTIVKHTTQIEDNYYASLRGGWSSNSLVQLLIVELAELETFIARNFIIYDAYSNWDRLFEQVTKGLFASHAMRSSESSSLQTFDDYLVATLVFNGERKTILKYFNRYLLKDLAYKPTNQDSGFLKMALNFLSNEGQVREELEVFEKEMGGRFDHRFNEVFKNLMTMASLLEVSAFTVETFAQQLLAFLKTEKLLNRFGWESVGDFIDRKGKYFSRKLKNSYLTHFIKTLAEDESNHLEELLKIFEPGQIKEIQHKNILSYIFKPNPQGTYENKLHLLTLLAKKSDSEQKQRVIAEIKKRLADHFDFILFYHATIFELIPLNRNKVLNLFDEINLEKKRYSFRSISTGREDQYLPRLDQLLNICFKYKISLKIPQIIRMKDAGPYYAWLIDMDDFDYSAFPFEWVSRYPTDFYYKAMAKSGKLKAAILEHLRTNSASALERALIKISFFSKGA